MVCGEETVTRVQDVRMPTDTHGLPRPRQLRCRLPSEGFTAVRTRSPRLLREGNHGKALTQLIWEERRQSRDTRVVRKWEKPLLLSARPPSVHWLWPRGCQVLLPAGAPLARDRCRSYLTETIRKSRRVAP